MRSYFKLNIGVFDIKFGFCAKNKLILEYCAWLIFEPGDEILTPTIARSSIGKAIVDNIAYLRRNPFDKSVTYRLKLSEEGYVPSN